MIVMLAIVINLTVQVITVFDVKDLIGHLETT